MVVVIANDERCLIQAARGETPGFRKNYKKRFKIHLHI